MLGDITVADEIYIVCGYTDMRRAIDGLCAIVQDKLHMDPRRSALYLFCGKRCDRIKALLWEGGKRKINQRIEKILQFLYNVIRTANILIYIVPEQSAMTFLFQGAFQILSFYHKDHLKRSRKYGISGISVILGRKSAAAQTLCSGGAVSTFSGSLNALGCSISSPDISQSNCCQVSDLTSSEFLGHRKRPCTSIRL